MCRRAFVIDDNEAVAERHVFKGRRKSILRAADAVDVLLLKDEGRAGRRQACICLPRDMRKTEDPLTAERCSRVGSSGKQEVEVDESGKKRRPNDDVNEESDLLSSEMKRTPGVARKKKSVNR